LHSSRHVFGPAAAARRGDLEGRIRNAEHATQDAVHPVVIRHPDTDRKAVYVNPGFTLRFDGWTEEESRPLLDYLYRHAVRPEFTCRFQWRGARWPFGTTARPGISRSTTITANAASCTASRSPARS
jgi:taurine dioxygenase